MHGFPECRSKDKINVHEYNAHPNMLSAMMERFRQDGSSCTGHDGTVPYNAVKRVLMRLSVPETKCIWPQNTETYCHLWKARKANFHCNKP